MSLRYRPIDWNRQKRLYDGTLAALLALSLGGCIAVSLATNPNLTAETLILRGTSLTALLLLHVILCVGPLARLDRRFLPLLYNRRHLGVTMFLLALVHGVFALVQFHALGDANPLVSVFTAYRRDYFSDQLAHFPFEPFGVAALLILFLMAATSHDFWLKTLGAAFWKAMHMGVYLAYGLVLAHVIFGALQSERSAVYPVLLGAGFIVVAALHLTAARKETTFDLRENSPEREGFVQVCRADELAEGRGKVVLVNGERVSVWMHQGRAFATSNVCRHQGGPLGEGRILDGCITCPWHGWNYRPEDGCSPPPFQEIMPTYDGRVTAGNVFVKTKASPLKTVSPGAPISQSAPRIESTTTPNPSSALPKHAT